MTELLQDGLLTGLPVGLIRARYSAAPGNEIASGKFRSKESSAALAANSFGLFLERPQDLPPLPLGRQPTWPALSVELEVENRFPWKGGRHPWLDVLIQTATSSIGIESKRYEPFRTKCRADFSDAYWRPVWGDAMTGYCRVRDGLRSGAIQFDRLDAVQLVKHAFGLRTAVHGRDKANGKKAVLVYLYAEPASWPNGRPVNSEHRAAHLREIHAFHELVAGDEVSFVPLSYAELLDDWQTANDTHVREHAAAIRTTFAP